MVEWVAIAATAVSAAIEFAAKNWLQLMGPSISVGGAVVSWYWARRRMNWDVNKELGSLRADTIEMLQMALLLGNPTWRRVTLPHFMNTYDLWVKQLHRRAPIIGKRAYRDLPAVDGPNRRCARRRHWHAIGRNSRSRSALGRRLRCKPDRPGALGKAQ